MAWYKRSKLLWDSFRSINPLLLGQDNKRRWRWIGGLGLAGVVYLTNLETAPYTNRTRFVNVPRGVENKYGELQYFLNRVRYNWKELPASHPTSARVESIAENVIKAAQRGLRDQHCGDPDHLNHWQVVVVDDPGVNAGCLPGGKIVLFAGLVKSLHSDPEIAYIIAHEVAHGVSRHHIEWTIKGMGAVALLKFLFRNLSLPFPCMYVLKIVPTVLAMLTISRMLEKEADYIGMHLMASAGYNPSVAAIVLEKIDHDSHWPEIFSNHPSKRKRIQLMGQAQDEVMTLYRKSLSSLEIKSPGPTTKIGNRY